MEPMGKWESKNVGKYAKNQSEETIPTECIEGLRFKIGVVFRVGS